MPNDARHNADASVQLFLLGQERGLLGLYEYFFPPLYAYALRYVKEQALAEDMASEAFIKLWQQKDRFESYHTIRAFLYVVVRNACLNQLARNKRHQQAGAELQHRPPEQDNILQRIMQKEQLAEVYKAISSLPPGCGEVVRMMYIEGKNYKEIASQLNLSINTIRSHRARGIALLRQRLQALGVWLVMVAGVIVV